MKTSRPILTIALMVTSLVLLLVLQAFWLRSSYEKAYLDFNREANGVFRSVVTGMRDSLVLKHLEPVNAGIWEAGAGIPRGADSLQLRADSTPYSRIQIYIQGTTRDSVPRDVIRTLVPRVNQATFESSSNKTFVLRMEDDTLHADSVKVHFEAGLSRAGFNNAVTIHQQSMPPPLAMARRKEQAMTAIRKRGLSLMLDHDFDRPIANVFADTVALESVRVNPMKRYGATLAGVRGVLLREITPQIFFSLFLTSIITIAFIVMYRNIRSQQKLMEIKNDFIRNVTHELKTPVATVSVAIEALKNFHAMDKPELTREYLDIAQNELNRLALMTDKILKTSIFETGKVEVKKELFDLDQIIEQVLASMKVVFEKRGAKVTYDRSGSDFKMEGGLIHVTNVVYNLIDNALKYSPAAPVIHLHLSNSPERLTLSVTDAGAGIEEAYHKKIFEKFFRIPTGDVHNTKGYGLGLNYVLSVVKSHEGSITVNSKVGEGSTFTVVLPKQTQQKA
ncbi:MAG: HAMP domain-containing histidine kinase [Bacteroidia bacterium]|nr:HAMP domain-containing histidine kinase [Bacteroidia bacterium]